MRGTARALRGCWGSALLAGLLIALLLVERAQEAVGNDARLLALGALPDSGGIHHGYWRLVAFGFLHSNLTHLLLNLLLLLLAGPAVERRAGTGWMTLIFLAASTASGAAILAKHELLPSAGTSVGASGGMFGLLAAGLLLAFRIPARPTPSAPPRSWRRDRLSAGEGGPPTPGSARGRRRPPPSRSGRC
jgi:membrane associated rhomboid family serine protease